MLDYNDNLDEYDPILSDQLKDNDKYKALVKWGLDNGVKLRSIDMPAAFGKLGLSGVVATQDIPANTAIIGVPYNIIITQEKCKNSELGKVYSKHPELFDEQETADAEFNILMFYLFIEKKKGIDSFYHPYIQAIQDKNTLLEWTDEQLNMIEDKLLLQEFYVVRDDMIESWNSAQKIFSMYPQIFGEPKETDRDDYYWASQSVMSRCFGWSLKSTSMVPVADFLNHSNLACTHYMVHTTIEQGQKLPKLLDTELDYAHNQYKIKHDKLDLSLLDITTDITQIPTYKDTKTNYIRKNTMFLEDNMYMSLLKDVNQLEQFTTREKRELINQINYTQLKKYITTEVWDLNFATSSDSEDNDSEEDIVEARSQQFDELRTKEIKEYQLRVDKIRKSNEPIIRACFNEQKKNIVKIKGLPQNSIDYLKQVQSDKIKDYTIDKVIKQQDIEQQQLKQMNKSDASSESSDESKWDWLEEDDKDAYFVIATTQSILKHQQVTVSYGRRTNRFLLGWYGFALPENKYSSFNFRLWLNVELLKTFDQPCKELFEQIVINKIMTPEDYAKQSMMHRGEQVPITQITKEFRLKKHKLNQDLLMYLRLYLMVFYNGPKQQEILITIPISIDYEIFVFQFTVKLLNYFLNQFSQGLAEDNQQLQTNIPYQQRFAIYVNRELKEILMSQIMIMLDAIIILKQYKEKDTIDIKDAYAISVESQDVFKKMENLRALKEYLKSIQQYV